MSDDAVSCDVFENSKACENCNELSSLEPVKVNVIGL